MHLRVALAHGASWAWLALSLLSRHEKTRIPHTDICRGGKSRAAGRHRKGHSLWHRRVTCHPEKGDGAVTAVGRGGNGAGSLTVTGAKLAEVAGAGQFSASTARWDGGYAERTNKNDLEKQGQTLLHSSLHPRGVCTSPPPLEPAWASTHPKSHLTVPGLH